MTVIVTLSCHVVGLSNGTFTALFGGKRQLKHLHERTLIPFELGDLRLKFRDVFVLGHRWASSSAARLKARRMRACSNSLRLANQFGPLHTHCSTSRASSSRCSSVRDGLCSDNKKGHPQHRTWLFGRTAAPGVPAAVYYRKMGGGHAEAAMRCIRTR